MMCIHPQVVSCGFDKRQDIFHVLDPNFVQCCNSTPPYPSGGRDDPLHISDESPLVDVQFHYKISVSFKIPFLLIDLMLQTHHRLFQLCRTKIPQLHLFQ